MRNRKLLVLLCSILVLALVAVGCSQPTDTPAPSTPETPAPGTPEVKDTLIVGQGADPVTLDPHATNDQPSSRVSKQIYDTLIVQTESMDLVSGLAESWEKIDDLTFEFKLKQGVKFHNGEELKASDVKFTFERALESSFIAHIVDAIDPEGIEIVDEYTVRISTKEPFAPILAHLAHSAAAILNEKAVTEAGEDYGQNPVGTGPYQFVKWDIGESVTLKRFDGYFGTPAQVENVVIRTITENNNRTIELETGAIDIAYDIQPSDVNRVDGNSELILLRDANLSTTYIGFNVEKAPFDNVKVRQAINHAVDMQSIVEAVYQGVGAPAKGPLGPNVFGANQELVGYEYDIEKAKALLAEAGYADGFKTSIWTNENQQRIDIAEIVQNQLGQIGIEVDVQIIEWGQYLSDTAAGKHDMFILGWTTVTADADYGLYALFHSSQIGDPGNRTYFANEQVDALLNQGRVEADLDKRAEFYKEAQVIIRDEAPWIFTWEGENLAGTRANVRGFVQHPAGHHKLATVYFE